MAQRISNYQSLVSAVVNVTEDDSQESRDYIPTAINLAEQRMARTLDSHIFTTQTTVSLASGSRFGVKPPGYRVADHVTFKSSTGSRKVLRHRTPSFCDTFWPYETSTAEPKYYADYDTSTFLFAPTPQGNSQIVVHYEQRPPALTSGGGVSINQYTIRYPNVLFYATMSEMCRFQKQWSQVQMYDALFIEGVQAANNEGRRARRDGTEPNSNPQYVNNTVKQGEN